MVLKTFFGLPDLLSLAKEPFRLTRTGNILVHIQHQLIEFFPTARIVLCQMMKHLQLVWEPLVSQKIAHNTALADYHLRKETSVNFVGLLAIAASTCVRYLHLSPFLVFQICFQWRRSLFF
ncbi:hypothetical protein AVEN_75069-1 [Araneus ventricosus]|uniref:Uncharacterized protein n=1 Tax=Araneus ventricosus TaxID=182803 RepID=A0A4Y2RZE0_ARAVE|nr:hypothetical protein AVEN_75069-1 [Araneus ventricosus]